MKHIIFHIIFGLIYVVGAAWASVSFILYLAKDRPFDWESLWLIGAGVVLSIVNFVFLVKRVR